MRANQRAIQVSHRKSRIAARAKRGAFGSTMSLVADAGKYRPGDNTFLQDVIGHTISEDRKSARLVLVCGHVCILSTGGSIWDDSIPSAIDCIRCVNRDSFTEEPFMLHGNIHKQPAHQLHNLIANGGKVIIVGGRNKTWESYRKHPQLEFWSGDDPAETGRVIRQHNNALPSNTHALIISKFISHSQLDVVMKDARRKRIVMFANLTDNEIFNKLDEIIGKDSMATTPTPSPTPPKPVAKPITNVDLRKPGRGEVARLVQQHDVATLTINESAASLIQIAREKGFSTTDGTLRNLIGAHRRALGIPSTRQKAMMAAGATIITPIPTPVPSAATVTKAEPVAKPTLKEPTAEEVTDLLKLFDDAIAGLQLTRDAVQRMAVENRDLRVIKVRMEKLLRGE